MITNFIYPILIVASMLTCCNNKPISNGEFIEKNKNYDFSTFINKSLNIRDFDKGNPIIFVYDHSKNERPCGFIGVTISATDSSVLKYSEVLQSGECEFLKDTSQIIQLAREFLKLNISYLKVDSNLNVLIKINIEEGRPNLGKFRMEDINLNEWTNIVDNWYERK